MFFKHTTSRGVVNSPSQELPAKEDIFLSVGIDLGFRGLAILRSIAHHCALQDGISCRISQQTFSIHSKSSVTTVKNKLNRLVGHGLIIKENILPTWHRDDEGKIKPDWSINQYTLTELGIAYIGALKMGEKPELPNGFNYRCPINTWDRSQRKEPTPRVKAVRALRQKPEGPIYIAINSATIPIGKEERKKKGDFFFHGMENKTQELRSGETESTSGECTEDQIRGQLANIGSQTGDKKANEGAERTTLSSIHRTVTSLVKSDSYTYALLPRKVENALNRGVIENVVLEKLTEIAEFKIKYWSSEFDRIVAATVGKKGEPFSYEENRNKNTEVAVGDRRRSGTADRQSGHRTAHRGRADTRQSRNEQDNLGANQRGVDYEQNGRVTENEPGRTSGYPTERGVPDPRSRVGSGGGIERVDETEPRRNTHAPDCPVSELVGGKRRITRESIDGDVLAIMECNRVLRNLSGFVNTLFKDGFSPAVVHRVLETIRNTSFIHWRGWGNNLADQYRYDEKNAQLRQDGGKREAVERAKRYDGWDEEKRKGPEKFDFAGMMEGYRVEYKNRAL